MKKIRETGFTLVELLIVISLIAILSVAVLATINPIEQVNKARDSKFKNDAAEVLSAYERYYASQNAYPWNADSNDDGAINNDEVGPGVNGIAFFARDWRFGVLNAAGDNIGGQLVVTSELKSSFIGKDSFKNTVIEGSENAMYVFHSNDSNYVCFCPKANANRTGTVASQLKCLNNVVSAGTPAMSGNSMLVDSGKPDCSSPEGDTKASTFCNLGTGKANLLCVPEGDIQ